MNTDERNPELRTEVTFLFDLIRQLLEGRVRIPRFQRAFVWRPRQMTDLLDSIRRQYPIGSLLAWDTDSHLGSLPQIGPVAMKPATRATSAFLLDGHQRLSTLAGALVSPGARAATSNDDLWNIYYNAELEVFEHLPLGETPLPQQLAMSKVLETIDFFDECRRALDEGGEKGPTYVRRFQEISRVFQQYKIPVIHIEETGPTEAVEIFARLNSRGQAMTADQMVSALLYREGDDNQFDLSAEIDSIATLMDRYGFGELNRDHILRILLGIAGEDIYRTDWSRIALSRRAELLERIRRVIPRATQAVESALVFLQQDVGVHVQRLLPYAQQVVVLSTFFYARPEPSEAQLELLRRWFWVTSFTEWFGTANPSRVNAMVRDFMDNVAQEGQEPVLLSMDLDQKATPIPASFDMRSARTKAHLLVMLSNKPRRRDGHLIEEPELKIELLGPGALGYVVWNQKGMELGRSPVNRILIDVPEDRRQAKAWMLDLGDEEAPAILRSHGIPEQAVEALRAGDISEFLRQRLRRIRELEFEFMDRVGVKFDLRASPAVVHNNDLESGAWMQFEE